MTSPVTQPILVKRHQNSRVNNTEHS